MAKQPQKSGKHPKASVEYNLEKDPLQTGIEVPATGLRERVAGDADQWGVRRRMAGILALVFMLIIVGIGIWAAVALDDLWSAIFGE